MSHARCNIAARTTTDKLKQAALAAFSGVSTAKEPEQRAEHFDDVLDFCQPRTEEIGGAPGTDAWYFWQIGPWAVMGDLGLLLQRDADGLQKLSKAIGEVVLCAIDPAMNYAVFAAYNQGQMKRLLTLEDGAFEALGLPVQAERGRPTVDFDIEEAERIWTSYGLPTFEYDPEGGPFHCVALSRE